MALGLVQPRSGDYIFKASLQDPLNSPRNIRKRTYSATKVSDELPVNVALDIVLDTPVLIVPRSSSSPHVLVAHLGRIAISNYSKIIDDITESYKEQSDENSEENLFDIEDIDKTIKGSIYGGENNLNIDEDDVYSIEIRNMNLFSLDTSTRKGFRLSALPRSEEFYSCEQDAVAIIHDTTIRLEIICRKSSDNAFVNNFDSSAGSFVTISETNDEIMNQLVISGSIVNPLRLSLKRPQYEQLIDTIENAFSIPNELIRPPERSKYNYNLISESMVDETAEKSEERKKDLFNARKDAEMLPKIFFTLPVFIIQLNNSDNLPVVEICFRDFNVTFEKLSQWETKLQVALRSVIMEDLLQSIESKHRIMVSSTNDEGDDQRLQTPFLSNSCPDLTAFGGCNSLLSSSLPNNLEQNVGFSQFMKQRKRTTKINTIPTPNCDTPPPSPQMKIIDDNLVIYSSLIIDPDCPQFESKYESMRANSCIDFNCLNLNISVESWFVLLNFFGLLSSDDESMSNKASNVNTQTESEQNQSGKSELNITIKSLNLILVKPEYELARANVSNARFIITKTGVCKKIDGSLGSISVLDLTLHGCIYREKFMTSGNEALKFSYLRECPKPLIGKRSLKKDAQLCIKMSSVRYVHTKRYVKHLKLSKKSCFSQFNFSISTYILKQ